MDKIPNKKFFSNEITKRFLLAREAILNGKFGEKVTASAFAKAMGSTDSNIIRLKHGENNVTIEVAGRLCHYYKISPYWLMTGKGKMDNNDELIDAHQAFYTKIEEMEKALKMMELSLKTIKGNVRTTVNKKVNKKSEK